MHDIFEKSVLKKVCERGSTALYDVIIPDVQNKYRVLSSEGTRQLMKCPEVVGYESYKAMIAPTTEALCHLHEQGLLSEANILTILRGGLNYPVEECCYEAGIKINNINFVSCERIIEKGVITGLDIKYEKLHIAQNCTLIIGDIVASGDTLKLCLREIVDRFRRKGGSIRKIYFFTVGGTRTIDIMEDLAARIRTVWPGFEGFECYFYEGIFTVYEDKGVSGVNIPMIDFGWKGGAVSPEFRREVISDPDALFEKCIIYDGGARRYEIPAHIEEVLEYWNAFAEVADRTDFAAFLAEKMGYPQGTAYPDWLAATHLQDSDEVKELYEKEREFIERSLTRSLADICCARIASFTDAMKKYL